MDDVDSGGSVDEQGVLPLSTVFDMTTMHPIILQGDDGDGDIIDALLSESGSITPRAVKEECFVNPDILERAIERLGEFQKPCRCGYGAWGCRCPFHSCSHRFTA